MQCFFWKNGRTKLKERRFSPISTSGQAEAEAKAVGLNCDSCDLVLLCLLDDLEGNVFEADFVFSEWLDLAVFPFPFEYYFLLSFFRLAYEEPELPVKEAVGAVLEVVPDELLVRSFDFDQKTQVFMYLGLPHIAEFPELVYDPLLLHGFQEYRPNEGIDGRIREAQEGEPLDGRQEKAQGDTDTSEGDPAPAELHGAVAGDDGQGSRDGEDKGEGVAVDQSVHIRR